MSHYGEDTFQQRNCIDPTLGLSGLADHASAFIVMKFQGAHNYKLHHACYLMHDTLKSAYNNFFNDVYMWTFTLPPSLNPSLAPSLHPSPPSLPSPLPPPTLPHSLSPSLPPSSLPPPSLPPSPTYLPTSIPQSLPPSPSRAKPGNRLVCNNANVVGSWLRVYAVSYSKVPRW